MSTTNSTTTAVTLWNAEAETKVRDLIAHGQKVPSALAKAAPKGFMAGLRSTRRETLRATGHLVIAQLESQSFKLEKCDADFDASSKQLKANYVRKNGDEVIQLTLVRKAETAEDRKIRELQAQNAELVAKLKALTDTAAK